MEAINTIKSDNNKGFNFYTSNGWAGSNYDHNLSTKEIAANVRSYAKKNFQDFKFSVRFAWSMYTDSLYIELKSGPCIPFVEGSTSAQRGYMTTMNNVKGFEDELTPEMFKVLDTVTTYANSFRYDDSNSMEDYFDTNFYLKISVSGDYQLIEPKVKKSSPMKEKKDTNTVEPITCEGLEIVDYSEKSIAVFGDTKSVKEQLKKLGGRFNPSLNYNGEKRAGWVFSKRKADKVKELTKPAELPVLSSEMYISSESAAPKAIVKKENTDMNEIRPGKTAKTYTVEAYEKKVNGNRYTVKDKPLRYGYYAVLDKLDCSVTSIYPTKEEAQKEADELNSFTDDNGMLKKL